MGKINLCVLFGGVSPEHEVSLNSTYSILTNIDIDKYNLYPVGITKSGRWLLVLDDDLSQVRDGGWETNSRNVAAILSPERGVGLVLPGNQVSTIHIDCVFPVLHGENGEDGSVQGLCQLAGIPCVGADVGASSNCMDKTITHLLTREIPQASKEYFSFEHFKHNEDRVLNLIESGFDYPVFVKPARAGSSVGVSKARDRESLRAAISVAGAVDDKVIVEEFIDGREIEVSVLGNGKPIASVCGEIVPAEEFYSYDAKYNNDDSKLHIPASLPDETGELIRETAVRVFRLMGCRGLARVDFFVRKSDGAVFFNEINTMPGFTDISMYPKMLEASGIPYHLLLDKLIDLAREPDLRVAGALPV